MVVERDSKYPIHVSSLCEALLPDPILWEVLSFFPFFGHTNCAAYRTLVPQPGIKSMPPAVEAQSHNHRISREVPVGFFMWPDHWSLTNALRMKVSFRVAKIVPEGEVVFRPEPFSLLYKDKAGSCWENSMLLSPPSAAFLTSLLLRAGSKRQAFSGSQF